MSARIRRIGAFGSRSGRGKTAGAVIACAVLLIAECGGSCGSAVDAGALVIRGDVAVSRQPASVVRSAKVLVDVVEQLLSMLNPTAITSEETRSAQREPADHHRHVRSGSSGAAVRRTSALPPAATVVGLVAVGKSIPEILDACHYLVEQGVMQALAYARTPVRCAANPLMASASLD